MWNAKEHTDLIAATRDLLIATGRPWVIENVPGAPLCEPITLCGTAFGLGTDRAELRRHRLFETSWPIPMQPPCGHGQRRRVIGVYGGHGRDHRRAFNGQDFPTSDRRIAMGIDWMTGAELSQAIPPAYTHFIGVQLMAALDQAEKETR
jgi:DNA (cytosine-5)-methyltransferase 1